MKLFLFLLYRHPTRWARNLGRSKERTCITPSVTIPHGGLGTKTAELYEQGLMKSPSHTVGLELDKESKVVFTPYESPSHAVGSELAMRMEADIPPRYKIAIPHGGLRTCAAEASFTPP